MALVDNGPHTIRVYLEIETTDWRDNKVMIPDPAGPVIVRRCWMQPIASTRGAFAARQVNEGQDVSQAYKLIARNAPVGWWSRVEWLDPSPTRKFVVLGGPLYRDYSKAVRHLSVTLQEER